jgi:hypothetical protein
LSICSGESVTANLEPELTETLVSRLEKISSALKSISFCFVIAAGIVGSIMKHSERHAVDKGNNTRWVLGDHPDNTLEKLLAI